ncbi:hypothetical protein M569_03524, partial [Genlisea aurea]
DAPVKIVAIVGAGSVSPIKSTPWYDVMLHTAKKLKWIDEAFEMVVFTDTCHQADDPEMKQHLHHSITSADIILIVAVTDEQSAKWIQLSSRNVKNVVSFDSSPSLSNKLGGSVVRSSGFLRFVEPESDKVIQSVNQAWNRHSSYDIRFCLLVIINAYIKPVQSLQNLRAKGFSTLNCMVKNCGQQILDCLLDPNCRKALQCLNKCSPVDQVCNYRCIASYENRKLEEFSLCVLTKHNCLELDAEIPTVPLVDPMTEFRSQALDHDTAEDLFVGWLGSLDWSWRVVAGENPAYDQFPCQYQLFYRGKARGSFWYEPVFRVKTLDNDELVWRRRKYRVKRGGTPGTFRFSVLDNGVVSQELWTIVDVGDDLSWGLFHYHGAARVAGQSYTGAVLVSPTGSYPEEEKERRRVRAALEKCGVVEWELFDVDNCCCDHPPLGLPEGSRFHRKIT